MELSSALCSSRVSGEMVSDRREKGSWYLFLKALRLTNPHSSVQSRGYSGSCVGCSSLRYSSSCLGLLREVLCLRQAETHLPLHHQMQYIHNRPLCPSTENVNKGLDALWVKQHHWNVKSSLLHICHSRLSLFHELGKGWWEVRVHAQVNAALLWLWGSCEGGPERDKASMRDKGVQIVCHLPIFASGVSR